MLMTVKNRMHVFNLKVFQMKIEIDKNEGEVYDQNQRSYFSVSKKE
jgi:hypothetical protein